MFAEDPLENFPSNGIHDAVDNDHEQREKVQLDWLILSQTPGACRREAWHQDDDFNVDRSYRNATRQLRVPCISAMRAAISPSRRSQMDIKVEYRITAFGSPFLL